jgi:hypothetical protein
MQNPLNNTNEQTGDYILSEAGGMRSRDNAMMAAGIGDVLPGRVLGRVTGTGQYKPHDPAATDGSQVAVAINYARVRDSATPTPCVVTARDCEVKRPMLSYHATDTPSERDAVHASLAAVGIIVR